MKKDKDLQRLQEMKPTQCRYVNWFEESGGEVQMVHDMYVLFEVSPYGGIPQYVGTYHRNELHKIIDTCYSWI
tara:strand:- start:335 stop:553 length:219 start_codon:yes stop_codon:yes gene_type:complete